MTTTDPLILPADEFAALKRSCRTLANIVARNHQVMEAARIEMLQNGPHAAMQWILNSIPDVWDDPETEWDGKESAGEWFDRTESFYRATEAEAPAAPSPPVAAALEDAEARLAALRDLCDSIAASVPEGERWATMAVSRVLAIIGSEEGAR